MEKSTVPSLGSEWQLHLAANKPATRVDVDELTTELVSMGVSANKIDKAVQRLRRKLHPHLSSPLNQWYSLMSKDDNNKVVKLRQPPVTA